MARNKNNLKKIEDFAERTGMMKPRSLSNDDIADIQRTIEDGWIKTKVNPNAKRETRSLAEIVDAIEKDPNKSPARKELEIRIAGIAHRISSTVFPQTAVSVSTDTDDSTQPGPDSESELSAQLRELRKTKVRP